MRKFMQIAIGLLAALSACTSGPSETVRADFQRYYDQFQVSGSFALYDQKQDRFTFYRPDEFEQEYLPASTFKVCNTLIGLETGVIPDENYTMAWDSVTRNPNWDRDHNLRSAFKYSVVWYYQELARRVGGERMQYWLDQAAYGNRDTTGGIDRFWLTGGLRISPRQQIDFLRRLHDNKLPFSARSLATLKDIMIDRQQVDYVLRGKTGWGSQDDQEIGWFVGYLETADNVYYFANCVQTPSEGLDGTPARSDAFNQCRRAIVDSILVQLQLIDQPQ